MVEKYNIERVPVVKRQAMSAFEPRSIKGTGVTFATSPQGADHTCGFTLGAKIDHLDPKGQVELSRRIQYNMAGYDTLGACLFAGSGYAATPDGVVKRLLEGRYGWDDLPDDILAELGKETLKMEREFNRYVGFTAVDDRLPEWMTREPLPPHNTVFNAPEDELDHIFDEIE